jgi:hypothetical protein
MPGKHTLRKLHTAITELHRQSTSSKADNRVDVPEWCEMETTNDFIDPLRIIVIAFVVAEHVGDVLV